MKSDKKSSSKVKNLISRVILTNEFGIRENSKKHVCVCVLNKIIIRDMCLS